MLIIGCDYHPSFQQIAFVNTETGELEERHLAHREEAERFYSELKEEELDCASGNGSQRALALVRALAAGTGV